MAGHRDDGTFANDKRHHPRRKVSRANIPQWLRDFDPKDPQWMPPNERAKVLKDFAVGPTDDTEEELEPWAPEDIEEQQRIERMNKNKALGYPEDYDGGY